MFANLSLAVISLALSWGLTWLARIHALRQRLLDVPNERSSHVNPTPRGGGIAFVTASLATLTAAWFLGHIDSDLIVGFGIAGLAIAIVGYMDDRRGLPPTVRLLVHVAAAVWVIFWLGGVPPLQWGTAVVDLGWVGNALGVLAIAGAVNLFNFMDGIDGLAASEAAFICLTGALLALLFGQSSGSWIAAMIVGAATLGFLAWNWPPAAIFMGDVGSGYLGFAVAAISLACARDQPVAALLWMVLSGVFLADSLVTLVRRIIRGERVHEAHRTHAYQWLARRWASHKRVTLAVLAVNVAWLLPWALLASWQPQSASWVIFVALAPLVIAVIAAGAGRAESKSTFELPTADRSGERM